MKEEITKRQKDVLNIIKKNLRVLPPTQEIIACYLGIKKQTVNEHIKKLIKKGFLTKEGYPIELEANQIDLLNGKEIIFNSTNFNDYNRYLNNKLCTKNS